jgi:hypothetical protein
MLSALGMQKTVKYVDGNPTNTFKYDTGAFTFPSAGSFLQADLGGGVSGDYSPSVYNSIKSFFISRGASSLYADTMTGLTMDMAAQLDVTPQTLIETSLFSNKLFFSDEAYRAMNNLRDPGNQLGTVTSVDNRLSLQARQIRS